MLRHDNLVCSLGEISANSLEGIWGTRPRSEADRTDVDAGVVECDPVSIFVTGVNGTLIRLTNAQGR